MEKINKDYQIVPLYWAASLDGALVSDIISLKNFAHADIFIMVGAVTKAAAVTLHQGPSISSATVALAFARMFKTGFILKYDTPSNNTPFTVGETITGAGAGTGVVVADLGDRLVMTGSNGTAFVDNELLTGGTSGRTATADGIGINEDIMVPQDVTSNTFNIEAVANRVYCIPVDAESLNAALNYDCLELNIADADTTLYAAWAVLSGGRYMGEVPQTAIYN